MLGVLVVVLGRDLVPAQGRIARQRKVAFVALLGIARDRLAVTLPLDKRCRPIGWDRRPCMCRVLVILMFLAKGQPLSGVIRCATWLCFCSAGIRVRLPTHSETVNGRSGSCGSSALGCALALAFCIGRSLSTGVPRSSTRLTRQLGFTARTSSRCKFQWMCGACIGLLYGNKLSVHEVRHGSHSGSRSMLVRRPLHATPGAGNHLSRNPNRQNLCHGRACRQHQRQGKRTQRLHDLSFPCCAASFGR